MTSFVLAGDQTPVRKSNSARRGRSLSGSVSGWFWVVFVFWAGLFSLIPLSSSFVFAADVPGLEGAAAPNFQSPGLFGAPLLEIIYAAETRGEVYPCFY